MTLLTDEAVEAAAVLTKEHARRVLTAFIAHHEGERSCERCGGTGASEDQHRDFSCPDCGGTGKVRDDKLVKLSEVVALLREKSPYDGYGYCKNAADYIERMAKEGKL